MNQPIPADGRDDEDEQRNNRQTVFTDWFLSHPVYPLVSAADVEPGCYTEVEFDDKIICILRRYARQRAPNRRSAYKHHIGITGERAVSVWKDVPLDTRITGDYEGDRGYDLEIPQRGRTVRVEVKTTQKSEPEATIKRARVDEADLFVLCRTNGGLDRVEIIGYASRPSVKEFGDHHGSPGYQLVPEYLYPTLDKRIPIEEVRDSTYQH